MPEWSIGTVSKTVVANGHRGFESLPLRHCSTRVRTPSEGEVAERSKAHDWKSCVGETLPGVRIPLSPPLSARTVRWAGRSGAAARVAASGVGHGPAPSELGWGSSSVGRAPGSQSGGRGFDPHLLHHFSLLFAQGTKASPLGHAFAPSSSEVVLDGELAVPCNPQSAIAGFNSPPRS